MNGIGTIRRWLKIVYIACNFVQVPIGGTLRVKGAPQLVEWLPQTLFKFLTI